LTLANLSGILRSGDEMRKRKEKSVGTPKRERARRGVLQKRRTSGSRVAKLYKRRSFDEAFEACHKIRPLASDNQTQMLEHSKYGMDPAWADDLLEKLEYIEKVFHFLKVDPSYWKSHTYYLKASVHELLEMQRLRDPS
jgi:hypothetical protein